MEFKSGRGWNKGVGLIWVELQDGNNRARGFAVW